MPQSHQVGPSTPTVFIDMFKEPFFHRRGIAWCSDSASRCSSERPQILNEVSLLLGCETEITNPVVVHHAVGERGCGAVVEVWRVLPQPTQRSGAVRLPQALAAMSGRKPSRSPDDEALADHRLTVENVRQMFAVERELL
jgi:hypothetical protein